MTRCRHHLHHHHRHHVLCALHLYWILFVVIFHKGKQKYKTNKQYPKKLFPPSIYSHCSSPPKPPRSSAGEDTYIVRCSKTTYGRSPIKPTVGRLTDLPWVASTTYSRFLLPPPQSLPRGTQLQHSKAQGMHQGKGISTESMDDPPPRATPQDKKRGKSGEGKDR